MIFLRWLFPVKHQQLEVRRGGAWEACQWTSKWACLKTLNGACLKAKTCLPAPKTEEPQHSDLKTSTESTNPPQSSFSLLLTVLLLNLSVFLLFFLFFSYLYLLHVWFLPFSVFLLCDILDWDEYSLMSSSFVQKREGVSFFLSLSEAEAWCVCLTWIMKSWERRMWWVYVSHQRWIINNEDPDNRCP